MIINGMQKKKNVDSVFGSASNRHVHGPQPKRFRTYDSILRIFEAHAAPFLSRLVSRAYHLFDSIIRVSRTTRRLFLPGLSVELTTYSTV